ncbi:MarR family transcriptional regulator [Desulforamulus aquiferis]|uniref:MarR family transcriptional regulator n=2 Tax=Desulforamulus aquiferis TaxID=1397668 RepID=A0AAW7ZAB4_9FIRM|nr:MarR family transcriptional regulator [Desulforamulus aquiferis]
MQFKKADWHQNTIDGCRYSEIKVLFCIKQGSKSHASEMKVSDISKYLKVTAPTITQLIKSLEAKGLVERNIDQTDRRAVRIKLTSQGEKITERAENAFYTSFNGLVEYLGEEQSNQLADLLSKVFTYFKEQDNRII